MWSLVVPLKPLALAKSRLASAAGQLPAVVQMDLDQGRFMTAEQAVGYGLIDEVAARR